VSTIILFQRAENARFLRKFSQAPRQRCTDRNQGLRGAVTYLNSFNMSMDYQLAPGCFQMLREGTLKVAIPRNFHIIALVLKQTSATFSCLPYFRCLISDRQSDSSPTSPEQGEGMAHRLRKPYASRYLCYTSSWIQLPLVGCSFIVTSCEKSWVNARVSAR
jgi:hypothetical protein